MAVQKDKQYLVCEDVVKAVESVIKLLNSQDLTEVDRANAVVPSLLAAIRLCPFDEDDLEKFLANERQEILNEVIAEVTKFEKECHDDIRKTHPDKISSVKFYETCEEAAGFMKARLTRLKRQVNESVV